MAYLMTIRNGSNLKTSGTNFTSLCLVQCYKLMKKLIKMQSTSWTVLIMYNDLVIGIGFQL